MCIEIPLDAEEYYKNSVSCNKILTGDMIVIQKRAQIDDILLVYEVKVYRKLNNNYLFITGLIAVVCCCVQTNKQKYTIGT